MSEESKAADLYQSIRNASAEIAAANEITDASEIPPPPPTFLPEPPRDELGEQLLTTIRPDKVGPWNPAQEIPGPFTRSKQRKIAAVEEQQRLGYLHSPEIGGVRLRPRGIQDVVLALRCDCPYPTCPGGYRISNSVFAEAYRNKRPMYHFGTLPETLRTEEMRNDVEDAKNKKNAETLEKHIRDQSVDDETVCDEIPLPFVTPPAEAQVTDEVEVAVSDTSTASVETPAPPAESFVPNLPPVPGFAQKARLTERQMRGLFLLQDGKCALTDIEFYSERGGAFVSNPYSAPSTYVPSAMFVHRMVAKLLEHIDEETLVLFANAIANKHPVDEKTWRRLLGDKSALESGR